MTMADVLFDCVEAIKQYENLFPGAYTEHSNQIQEVKKSMTELQVSLDREGTEFADKLCEAMVDPDCHGGD
ncbi:MAG: hypothetical protein ACR2NF_12060 [Pirellulales bacterium]